jgi:hypothetical protein
MQTNESSSPRREKKAHQVRFAKGAQELDNAIKRAVGEGVNTNKQGDASNTNPK